MSPTYMKVKGDPMRPVDHVLNQIQALCEENGVFCVMAIGKGDVIGTGLLGELTPEQLISSYSLLTDSINEVLDTILGGDENAISH